MQEFASVPGPAGLVLGTAGAADVALAPGTAGAGVAVLIHQRRNTDIGSRAANIHGRG